MVQTIIALIYDFDGTLSPDYMQKPIFEDRRFKISEKDFWEAKEELVRSHKARGKIVEEDTAYLQLMIQMAVPGGPLEGLTEQVLRELGGKIEYFPGIPEFFANIRSDIEDHPEYKKADIKIEHYIASTGLIEMLRGSSIAKEIEVIDACEFFYDPKGVPIGVARALDYSLKTQTLYKINKGVFQSKEIDVNTFIPPELRRIPISNFVFFGDGPSDVPCMSMVRQANGFTFAVYNPMPSRPRLRGDPARNAFDLYLAGRANFCHQADYRKGTDLYTNALYALRTTADRIVEKQRELMRRSIVHSPKHF